MNFSVGQSIIVILNDPRAVHLLLNKKSALFADRPVDEQWARVAGHEMMALTANGPLWRTFRKVSAQVLSP
jgi:cytochrome P450